MKTLQTAGCSNLHPRLLCYRLTVDGSASAPRTANSRAKRRVSRRWPQPHAVSEQQQQQPEQPGGGRPPPGWSSSFVALSMLKYDEFLQASQEAETEGKAALQTLDDQINELQQDRNTPKWAYRAMAWSRGMAKDAAEMARKRHAAVASKRHLFMEAVTAMDADISEQPEETAVEWMVMAAWNWAQSEEEGKDESLEGLTQLLREALNQPKSPSIVLYAAVLSSLATAWGVAWAGSWWGVDAYRLLHDSPDWGAMAATWLAWTLPYVGGTAAAYFIAPSIITKSIIRPLVTDQSQFYRSVPFASFVFAAGCVAFSQNLVWQGLWQDVFINWMGGSRDPLLLTDPAQLEDSVRLSMGTLVGSPRLPAFLVAPAAALLTGLLEAGFFWTAIQARSINALIPVVTDDGNEEELRAVIAVNVESSPLSPEELLLVSGRVALASSFLCLEGTLTGSLWLPIATSAAGLITAIQLSKRGSA